MLLPHHSISDTVTSINPGNVMGWFQDPILIVGSATRSVRFSVRTFVTRKPLTTSRPSCDTAVLNVRRTTLVIAADAEHVCQSLRHGFEFELLNMSAKREVLPTSCSNRLSNERNRPRLPNHRSCTYARTGITRDGHCEVDGTNVAGSSFP